MVIAQMKHETGNFKSNAYKTYHNCFGMTKVTQRATTQLMQAWAGEYQNNTGAIYKSDFDSVYDMMLYIRAKIGNGENWVIKLTGESGFTAYLTWLKEQGFYTADYVAYQRAAGAYYQAKGITNSVWFSIALTVLTLGVSITVLFYTIRKVRKYITSKKQKKEFS